MADPVVHLALCTDNLARACDFYTRLFGWSAEIVHASAGSYLALDLGTALQGGVSEHDRARSHWLPYVEVRDLERAIERARRPGAAVTLPPREGPAGWRSVLAPHAGAQIALWQPKL